jgi:hypothetical protein
LIELVQQGALVCDQPGNYRITGKYHYRVPPKHFGNPCRHVGQDPNYDGDNRQHQAKISSDKPGAERYREKVNDENRAFVTGQIIRQTHQADQKDADRADQNTRTIVKEIDNVT